MADAVTKLAYEALQQGKSLVGVAHKEISTRLMEFVAPDGAPKTLPIPPQMLRDLQASHKALLDLDWQEAEAGLYPTNLLFDAPWGDWAARYPLVWLDMPSTWTRRSERNVRDLPTNVETENYPDYYLQNFHHQTDGYLSDHSATLYDLQVEILFNGTADPMRRRVIKPLVQGLRAFGDRPSSSLRVLDVAPGAAGGPGSVIGLPAPGQSLALATSIGTTPAGPGQRRVDALCRREHAGGDLRLLNARTARRSASGRDRRLLQGSGTWWCPGACGFRPAG
jgi:hypothetical protein